MELYLGTVSEVTDSNKFIIKFDVLNQIESMLAYPIDTFDEPNIGDPIIVYQIESIFGYSYMYKKLRLQDYTRMKLGNSEIDITNDSINITTKDGSMIVISSDGDIVINSNGAIRLQSDSKITIDAPQVSMTGSNVSGGQGPFCSILTCPVTGLPHTGNTVSK